MLLTRCLLNEGCYVLLIVYSLSQTFENFSPSIPTKECIKYFPIFLDFSGKCTKYDLVAIITHHGSVGGTESR